VTADQALITLCYYFRCDIKPKDAAKEFLSSVLDMTSNLSAKENKIRDDQATLLYWLAQHFGKSHRNKKTSATWQNIFALLRRQLNMLDG